MGCEAKYFCDICGETVSSGWVLNEIEFNHRPMLSYDVCDKCDKMLRKFITEKIEEGRMNHGRN